MGITTFARWIRWHLHALGSNPLIRATDRLEALAALAVLATMVIAVPVAAQAGSLIYEAGVQTADEQAHDRHPVQTVAIEGNAAMPTDFNSPSYVRVQWREGTRVRTEQVISPATVTAGDPVTIWLTDSAKVVPAPLTMQDAKLSAAGAAGTAWVAIVVGSALIAFLVRRRLDRSRMGAWERELQLLAHNDDGWANRHT